MGKKPVKKTTDKQLEIIRKICVKMTAEKMTEVIGIVADCSKGSLKRFNRKKFREELDLPPLVKKIPKTKAESDTDVIIFPATMQEFVTRKKFVVDIRSDSQIRILSFNEYFRENYLGKIEKPIGESRLRYRDVVNALTDSALVTELGGEDKAEVALIEMFFLMKKQGDGKSGELLVDGHMNTLYVRDIHGALGRVSFFWRKNMGWIIEASGLDNMHQIGRVFYRD